MSFLVLDDLGLLRHHADVRGIAIALVVDDDGELAGNYGLDGLGERIIAIEVSLHEVGQVKLGTWFHGERHGVELARHLEVGVRILITKRAAEGIINRNIGGSIL